MRHTPMPRMGASARRGVADCSVVIGGWEAQGDGARLGRELGAMTDISIVPVDERDCGLEVNSPRFRVYLHGSG
jgi:hypothetical protein